ncbi:transcriptional repressor [bacterium]|nr:transcriptional repressor [bacterium]
MNLEEIKEKMRENSLRVTQTRIDIATLLLKNPGKPLSSEEIFSKVSKSKTMNCDQVSVYRVLSAFEKIGLVTKSIFQGEASRYMIDTCGKKHEHHHHYFKCKGCQKIEPFDGCFITRKEKEMESKGYTGLSHHIELVGYCPDCS